MSLQNLVYSNRPLPRLGRHLLFWLGFVIYRLIEYMPVAELYQSRTEWLEVSRNAVFHIPVMAMLVYTGIYFVLPRYLANSRFRAAAIICSALFLVAFGLNFLTESVLSDFFYQVPIAFPEHVRSSETTTIALMVPFFVTAIAFRMTKDHIVRQREYQQLLLEKLQSEFRLTKARLQPVILLDALKDIYADITGEYCHAPGMILNLSDLLHYILYETDIPRVAISKEIRMMEEYTKLKSALKNKKMMTEFVVSGNPEGKTIPPLLCLPLIDMLFRRSGMPESVSRISVAWWFQSDRSTLSLTCMQDQDKALLTDAESAILQATKSSLEINYPGNFTLEVDEGTDRLDIFMEINMPVSEYA